VIRTALDDVAAMLLFPFDKLCIVCYSLVMMFRSVNR
jgi:hypothetical protein